MSNLEKIMPRGEQSVAAKGNNSEKLLKEYVEKLVGKFVAIEGINGEIKEILRSAKNDGFLKTSLRKTIKQLRMTEEQLQAKAEVDEATRHYTELCKDLPLFKQAAAA